MLTTHPTYQRVANEFMQCDNAGAHLANGKAENNNGSMQNGNGSIHYNKKFDWGFFFFYRFTSLSLLGLFCTVLCLTGQTEAELHLTNDCIFFFLFFFFTFECVFGCMDVFLLNITVTLYHKTKVCVCVCVCVCVSPVCLLITLMISCSRCC